MKHTIYAKLLLGYLIMAIAGFALIYLITTPMVTRYVEKEQGSYLYGRATQISKYFNQRSFQTLADYKSVAQEFNNDATLSDAVLWVVTRGGEVCLDSSGTHTAGTRLPHFDSSYFGSRYYKTGNFNNNVKANTLSTIAPINSQYTTIGYVLLHMDHTAVEQYCQPYYYVIYTAYSIMLGVSFLILLFFTLFVYIPLRKIISACQAYAAGNLEYGAIRVHANDEIGQLAANLEYMARQLTDLEEYQQKFIANISHDFRSPLTSIKGYLEAILDGTIPVEIQDKYLKVVLNETERLNKLTENLLTINAWDTTGRKLILSDFDIVQTIRDTLATFEGTCIKKKISVNLLLGNKSYLVTADLSKIQQVLYNLIDNAIKFSPANASIQISITDKNEKVFISIKDQGIGIPRDSIHKIWDRFYKTDLSRGKDKTGSGLGLSITKEIIQSHNENIDVISTEGVGTEFIFSLQKAKS